MKMVIGFNNLSGNVPPGIGDKLKHLQLLDLQNNHLTAAIPASLSNLSSLSILDLGFNLLEGTIPNSIGVLKDFWYLNLGFNNLSGEPPISLYNLSSCKVADSMEHAQW